MNDRQLQQQVTSALDWDPSVTATKIGVTTDNGVVTLRGDVASFSEKRAAERIALHVYGVKGVANDLNVQLAGEHERTDTELAQDCVKALEMSIVVPRGRIGVAVTNGWATLTGTVDWQFQKDAAARAVRDLIGLQALSNDIVVHPPAIKVDDVKHLIEGALRRSAELDAGRISVTIQDNKVTLTGDVRSWSERQAAERAVWSAPGVAHVEDLLAVMP